MKPLYPFTNELYEETLYASKMEYISASKIAWNPQIPNPSKYI